MTGSIYDISSKWNIVLKTLSLFDIADTLKTLVFVENTSYLLEFPKLSIAILVFSDLATILGIMAKYATCPGS